MPDKITSKYKEKRSILKCVNDVVSLLKTRHDFNVESLEYFDEECNTYIIFNKHTFHDADFEHARCVRMRVMDMVLNEGAPHGTSPIVVAPSDDSSSQSASALEHLVPGIPIDFLFQNPSEPQYSEEDTKPPKSGPWRSEISARYVL